MSKSTLSGTTSIVGGKKGDELQMLLWTFPLLPRVSLPGPLIVVFVCFDVAFDLVVVVFISGWKNRR